jgi:hypothetical protein
MSSTVKAFPSLFIVITLTSLVNCRNEGQKVIQSSVQETTVKIGEALISEDREKAPLHKDTACNRNAGIFTWEGIHNLFEEINPKVMGFMATTGSSRSSEASVAELACSFLHQRAARPKILPCIEMVKGILDSVDIKDRQFMAQGQELSESLFSQNFNFTSATRKHARGENRTKEAQIKKQRHFLRLESRIAG